MTTGELKQPTLFPAKDRLFFVAKDGLSSDFPQMREAEVQKLVNEGFQGYILRLGDDTPWRHPKDYDIFPQTANAAPPFTMPASAPVAPERQFYIYNNNQTTPASESEVRDWLGMGWNGPVVLLGETEWKTAEHYGITHPNHAPAAVTPQPQVQTQPQVQAQVQPAPAAAAPALGAALPAGWPGPATKSLLKEFSKRPGCEDYKNDGDRIKLLTLFVLVRHLAPGLTLDTFLELFAPMADYNEENKKHPEDALSFFCPRNKKAADARGVRQWSAKEVADYLTAYVDRLRASEAMQQPVVPFNEFLATQFEAFARGDYNVPEPEAEKGKRSSSKAPASSIVVVRPTASGQRIKYTMAGENGRQVRGVVDKLFTDGDRQYVSFTADGGEYMDAVNLLHCEVIDDPLPPGAVDATGTQKQVLQREVLRIKKAEMPTINAALGLKQAMGNVAIGDNVGRFVAGFSNGYEGVIEIVNGETGPFVDARLMHVPTNQVIYEIPPRHSIVGEYQFEIETGVLLLEVKANE